MQIVLYKTCAEICAEKCAEISAGKAKYFTFQLVYVNYGRVEDLAELELLNVNVSGKICIARYGAIYRGNKVHNCQDRGAIGVILFSDPADVAPLGTNPNQVSTC